ncbi:MAG TPA: anthranilate phosphoribosyltransferase [Pseudonocardiaceae bacterium]|nr:anthranilate phosphoribosyltransferase [Pseudonocardiaceae bacterium]
MADLPAITWPALLSGLVAGHDLTPGETVWAIDQIMSGQATAAQIAGFAVSLRAKGETPAEINGMARALLEHATSRVVIDRTAVDVVGTGGDGANTVNISTMAAIVTAAAGVPVLKHGNRAASSKSGTADVLEALGVLVDQPAEGVRACFDALDIGFCYAPRFHPALRHTSGPRRELGIPTAFNLLGPLANPGQPTAGLIGCANARLAPVLAGAFAERGATVLVVRGDDGLDELTTTTTSTVWQVRDGAVHPTSVDPARLGIPQVTPEALRGGDAAANAKVIRELVAGETGAVRDAVVLNAAGAIAAYRGFSADLDEDLRAAITTAAEALDSGAAATLLDRWSAWRPS